jgi:hypothetical protein
MVTISEVLDQLALTLQDLEVDENNMACVRFPVGDQTWKVYVYWDIENEDLKMNIKRRD